MNDMAKLVHSASGQSVELPERFRFDGSEVRIRREGDCVVLEPADAEINAETGLTIAHLRALIDEGMESGPSEEWDREEFRRFVRTGGR